MSDTAGKTVPREGVKQLSAKGMYYGMLVNVNGMYMYMNKRVELTLRGIAL